MDAHANFAYSTVATAPSPATSGTSLVLQSGDGAKFPAAPFNVTIWPAGATPTTSNAEIARCTAKATDTLTIVRAQESSSARSVGVGDQIAATVTVKTLTDLEAFFKGWTNDGGNPADLNSNGGALTVGQLKASPASSEITAILKRHAYVGDPTFVAPVPQILQLQDENGNVLFFIDAFGGMQVNHDPIYPPPPDGHALNQLIFSADSDDGSSSQAYFLGMGAFVIGGSLYGQVGVPWTALQAKPYFSIVYPSTPNGYCYGASVAGTTGSVEPTWPTSYGATVVDGTVTWYCFGQTAATTPIIIYGPSNNDGHTVVSNRVNVLEIWNEEGGSKAWGIGPDGEEQLFVTTPPADADVATSSRSQYYDDTVGAPKLWIKQRDSAGTLFLKIAAALSSDGSLDMHSEQIHDVVDPTSAQDAATKNYVDTKITGFGDGSDGAAAFDGTTTVTGASSTGSSPNKVYTLTRDVYYTSMSVSTGKTLNTGGFRIFVQGTLTNAGTIQNVGGAGSGTTAGAAAAGGSVAGGAAGAAGTATGTTTVAGTAAGNTNAGYSNIGGRGGSGGGTSPGAAGTLSTIARVPGWRDVFSAGDLMWVPPAAAITSAPGSVVVAGGGTGGGGGGRVTGGTTTATGAGGGGGGIVFIAAGSIVNTGTISAAGGAGGNATGGTCSAGGGGGGGGGAVVLIYNLFSSSGTITAAAGALGTGLNGAAAASAGSAGIVIEIPA